MSSVFSQQEVLKSRGQTKSEFRTLALCLIFPTVANKTFNNLNDYFPHGCRQALFLHRQALIEQLKETEEPALVLHLASVLLFQASNQCMLHAPGRCVPQVIATLTGRIPTVPARPKLQL